MSKVAFEQDLNGIKLILVKMNNCFHKNLSAICQQIVRRQTTNSQLKVQKNVELERMKGESSTGFEPMTCQLPGGRSIQ